MSVVLWGRHGQHSWAWCGCGWTSRLCEEPSARAALEAHMAGCGQPDMAVDHQAEFTDLDATMGTMTTAPIGAA